MSNFVDIQDFVKNTKSLGVITGERMSGKTTGLKLYALDQGAPTIWLTRYLNNISDIANRWLSDLQVHDLAVEFSEEKISGDSTYITMVYTDEYGEEHTVFFVGLSSYRKLRGVEFAANGKKPWAIIFDEFVSDQYLKDEPRKLVDFWATVSRRDDPPLLILSGNADDDGTPYNSFFDISFFENSHKENINILRAIGYGYEETKFSRMMSDIMPQYNKYAGGDQKAVVIGDNVNDVGSVYFVYDSAISVHSAGDTVYIKSTDREPDLTFIDVNGSPTGTIMKPRIVKMIQRINNCNIIYGDRKAVRIWSWITKYAK